MGQTGRYRQQPCMPYCMQFAVVFPTMKAQLDAQEHALVNNSVAAVMYALSSALPGYKTPPCTLNPWLRAFSTSCPSFHRTVLKTCSSRDAEARSMSSSEELTPRQRRLLKQKRFVMHPTNALVAVNQACHLRSLLVGRAACMHPSIQLFVSIGDHCTAMPCNHPPNDSPRDGMHAYTPSWSVCMEHCCHICL